MEPSVVTPELSALLERRAFACRLTPDRALVTLEEAEAFVADRGMLTLTPDSALPSLFGACHEEPYRAGGHGFASWPKTRWWWGGALAERPEVHTLRIHRGKTLYLSPQTLALAAPLCRVELARASSGGYGPAAAELVTYLAAAGPSPLDDVKRELGLDAAALRSVRARLESVGAVVSRTFMLPAAEGGERESSELARWDQRFPALVEAEDSDEDGGLARLVVAGVRAAEVAPEREVASWFSWRLPPRNGSEAGSPTGGLLRADLRSLGAGPPRNGSAGLRADLRSLGAGPPRLVDELVEGGRLWRPQSGWLAARD